MGKLKARLKSVSDLLRKELVQSTDRPHLLASALGLGVFLGIFPIWGFQTFLAVVLAHLLKLNKALVLLGTCISLPPFIPIVVWLSYSLGAWLLGSTLKEPPEEGYSLLTASFKVAGVYFTGAVPLALIAGTITYLGLRIGLFILRGLKK